MLYWFFVKGFGWIARRRMGPTAIGLENVPREGGAIIAANHLAVIDDALIPITCPRMVHFMGKAEYFEGKGIKGRFKKWWFTSVGVFPWTVPAARSRWARWPTPVRSLRKATCSASTWRARAV